MSDVKAITLQVLTVMRNKGWVDYDGAAILLSRIIANDKLTLEALAKVPNNFFLFNKASKKTVLDALKAIVPEQSHKEVVKRIDVLILSASPNFGDPRIRVDKEYRSIVKHIRGTTGRDSFNLTLMPAVERGDLMDEINRVRPTILQLSTHGNEYSLLLDGEDEDEAELSAEQLEQIISTATPFLKVVILNACHSHIQAKSLLAHVDIAIGMTEEIGDKAAIDFSTQFYSSLAEGRSVQAAFDQAVIAIGFRSASNAAVPSLFVRQGVDATKYTLI